MGSTSTNSCWVGSDGDAPTIARRTISDKKHLLAFAVSLDGNNYFFQLLNQGESMDSERYVMFLTSMFQHFSEVNRSFIISDFKVMQDNARPHISAFTTEYFHRQNVVLLKQPAYSPDLNACDRKIFPAFEMKRCHQSFNGYNEVCNFVNTFLGSFLPDGMRREQQKIVDTCDKIIANGGNYVI